MPSGCGQSLGKPPVVSLGPQAHQSPAPHPPPLACPSANPTSDPRPVPALALTCSLFNPALPCPVILGLFQVHPPHLPTLARFQFFLPLLGPGQYCDNI